MIIQVDQWSIVKSITTVFKHLSNIAGFTNILFKGDDFAKHGGTNDTLLCAGIADNPPLHVVEDSDDYDSNSEQLCGLSSYPGQCLEPEVKDCPSHDLTLSLDKSTTFHVSAFQSMSPEYTPSEATAHISQAITYYKSDVFNPSTMFVDDTTSSKQLRLKQADQQSMPHSFRDFDEDHDYENSNNEQSMMTLVPMAAESCTARPHPSSPVDECKLSIPATETNHTCKQMLASSDSSGCTPCSDQGLLPSGMTKTNVGLDSCLDTLINDGEVVNTREMATPPAVTSSCDSHMESFGMLDYDDCTVPHKTSHTVEKSTHTSSLSKGF